MPSVRFSIIIRCTRGVKGIARLLKAIGDLDYPAGRFEVIVADSTAREPEPVDLPIGETAFPLRHLPLGAAGPVRALNIAVRESRGEFLAFLDEGCIPGPDWLKSYDRAFDAWLAGVIGGSFHPPRDGDAYQKCTGLVHSSLARSLRLVTGQQLVGRYYPRSDNMAARRESVLLAGGFDEEAVECPEIRMASRMQHIGYRAFYCPDAAVHCYHDPGLLRFVSKDFRTAAERARFCRRRSGVNLFPIGAAALAVFAVGLACDSSILAGHAVRLTAAGYLLALILSSLQAAISVGSLAVAVFLPLFLAIHHVVYTIGFAYGRLLKA